MRMLRNVPLPEPSLAGMAAGYGLHRVWPIELPGPVGPLRVMGWSLVASGAALNAWSVRAASAVDLANPDRLVSEGPYATSRNPMYLGWALIHGGAALAVSSVWMLSTLPLSAARLHREVRREERELLALFGEDFERHRAAVPRYVPRWARWAR